MRKSFTRFLGLLMLFCMMSLFSVAQTLVPADASLAAANVDNRSGSVTLTMTFAANMVPASGVGIIALSTGGGVQLDPIQITGATSTNSVTGSTATIVDKVVTLHFVGTYTEGAVYEITATGDALKSVTNVPWAGIAFGNWTITIADYTAPALIATVAPAGPPVRLTPADEATAVVLGNDFTAVFTEKIAFGTGNIGLYTQAGDVVELFELATDAGDFNAAPAVGKVSIDLDLSLALGGGLDGRTLYINPTNPLDQLQKYYVRIAPTAIVDLASVPALNKTANAFAGINNNTTWNFWAQDVTAPTAALTAGLPITHTKVARDEKPTLTFTDNMQVGLYPATLVLKTAAAGNIPTTTGGATAYFTMTQNAAAYATFTATYKGNNVFEFASTAAGNKWTSDAVYVITLLVNQVEDNQGNQNAVATFTFTADDFLAPTFAVATADNATGSATYLNSTGLFLNTTMADGSGLPVVVKYLVVPTGIAVTVADVVTNGTVLPQKVTGGVTSTTDHYAYVLIDYQGNTLASNTAYDVHFIATDNATVPNTSAATTMDPETTNDTIAPVTVVTTVAEGGVTPLTIAAAGSVANVDLDGVITMTFDEAITVGAGGIIVEYNTTGTTWAALTAGGTDYTYALGGAQKIVTITPAHRPEFGAGWMSSANYRVKIVASLVGDDLTGKTGSVNNMAAATYSFTTEDFMGPISTFKSSGNAAALHGRTGVTKTDNLIVTFTEAPRNESGALLTNANIKNYIQVRKGDGAGVNIASTDLNPDVAMTISGNVVTIDPVDPFASETYYGVWVSTLIEDDDGATGTKLNKYQDNATAITLPVATSEFATFKAADSRSPLVDIKMFNAAAPLSTVMTGVPNDSRPAFVIDESVKTVLGNTSIVLADPNQVRSLIELRLGSSTGALVNFDVDGIGLGLYGEAGTSYVIRINPIDFPAAYLYQANATYYVAISGLQDAAGNAIAPYSETFTVINYAALTRTITPAIAAVQVSLAGNIVITFDRNVNKVAAPMQLALDIDGLDNTTGFAMVVGAAMDGDVDIDISTGNAAVTVVNNVVTIPYAGLTANTVYNMYMMAGAFTAADNVAVTSAVINAASAYTFTTLDAQGPRVDLTLATTGVSPVGALTSPITGAKLRLDFDERVYIGTGVINIKKAEGGVATTVATIDMQSANIVLNPTGGDNTIVDVLIPVTLEYSTSYIVEMPATVFKDVHNNPWEWRDTDVTVGDPGDNTYGNRAVTAGTVGTPYVLESSVWDFGTIADPVPGYLLTNAAMVPVQGANSVSLTTGLTIKFSEPMSLNTVGIHNLSVHNSTNPASDQTIDLSTTPMTWNNDNTEVTIAGTLINDLTYGRNYWINIDAGAFKSVTNQSIAALTSTAVVNWFFTTTDATFPAIQSVSYIPADALGTQVDVDAKIVILFTEAVSPVTNWATSVTIPGAGLTNPDYSLAADNRTLTITPPANLTGSTPYTINLVVGQTQDVYLNLNLVDARIFTTEDLAAPAITVNAAVQAYSATTVKASITVTDFTTVAAAGINDITVHYLVTADGAYTTAPPVATMDAAPSYDIETNVNKQLEITGLTEKTKYDIWFMAVDKSKNANKSVVTKVNEAGFTLSTTDLTAPSIALLTPLTGTENINFNAHSATNVTLKIKWDEQVQVAAAPALEAQIVIRKMSDNTLVYTFDKDGAAGAIASDAAFTLGNSGTGFTNNQISCVIPGASLTSSTEYYVEIANGLVSDVYNSSVVATPANNVTNTVYIGNANWTFKTADEVLPALIANTNPLTPPVQLIPADDATGIAVSPSGNNLVMVFNEDIQKNTTTASWIRIYQLGTATPFEVIPVSGADVVVGTDKRTVTITRHNTYPSEVVMYVNIENNAFFDYAPVGNYYVGIAAGDNTTWNFTTKDMSVPRTDFLFDDATTLISSVTTVNSLADINSGVMIKFMDLSTTPGGYEILKMNGGAAPATVTSYVNVVNASGTTVTNTSAYAAGVITTTITGGYQSNQTYTITLTGGTGTTGLTDDAGNYIGTSSITFNTEDRLSPTLTIAPTLTNPTTPAAEVKQASRFRITFNKQIVNDVVADGTENIAPTKAQMEVVGNYFTFKTNPGGANVAYTVNVITAGLVYEIVPTTALTSEGGYQIIWQADPAGTSAVRVKDIVFVPGGNQLSIPVAANRTYTGIVEDGINPLRDGLTPATTVPLTIINADDVLTISFDEQVMGNNAAGKIQIRYSNGQIFDEINPEDCDFTDNVTFDVVITPNKLFDAHREYFVEIPAGAFTDDSYNRKPYAGFTGNVIWKFKTDDGLAPTVAIYSPLDEAYDIPVNSNLVLTFSENIQLGAAGKQFVIYFANGDNFPTNDGNAMEIITLPSAQVTVSGSNPADPMHTSDVVTINPAMTFDHNPPGQYYIRIDQGFVKDFAGVANLYAGIHDDATWNFNITDPTAPVLSSFTPLNGATTVPQTLTGATMTFDRDILAGTGFIRLYQYYYNSSSFAWDTRLIESINVNTATINHTTYTATFDVATRLLDNTVYYFLADNGSFTNTSSTHDWYTGLTDPFIWRFTTIQDVTAPVLDGALAVAATNVGATCLDPDAVAFDINFIEANGIQKGTGGLNIFDADDALVTTVPVSGAVIVDNKITFTVPASVLADKTEYYVTVDATAVKDNALVPNYFDSSVIAAGDWTFYTGDFTAPTLDAFTPITGTDNLENAVSLELTFSENVQLGYEALVVTKVSDGTEVYNAILTEEQIVANVATVELTGLEDGEAYSVTFGAGLVTDLAYTSNAVECGNLNASAALSTAWDFTIDDNVAPTIAGTPLGTNAPAAITITITASEAVTAVATKLVTITATDETPIEILVSDMVTTDNLVFTADLTGLSDNTTYTVTVASGSFIDGAVIPNATEVISWNFTTGDNTAPSVIVDGLTPTGALPTYIGVELTMTFDEAVVKGAGDIAIGAMVIPVSSENVTISEDGTVVTIVPTSDLTFQSYIVTVAAGAFLDANDNASPLTTWTFAIVDNTFDASCMDASHFRPFDNSINQMADVNLEMTFCEKVVPGITMVKVFKMVTAGSTLFHDYAVTADMISADGLTVSIPVTGLEDFTSYGVLVEAGAVKDEAGNNYLGISDPTFWNFTTGDNTAPTLLITSDQTDLTNATNDVVLTLTFDEAVYGVAAGVTATADGVSVTPEVLTGVAGAEVYTIKVTAPDVTEVVVTVAQTITDGIVVLNENALDQVYTYTYNVGDYTAPELVSAVAPEAPIATSFDVVLTFNEPMDSKIEGPFTITGGTITDAVVNTAQTEITLSITAVEEAEVVIVLTSDLIDQSVNENALVPVTLTYTVGDFTAPTVSVSPASGSTNQEATFDVVLTFSADAIVTAADITVAEATASSVAIAANVATVTITAADMTVVTVTAASTIADEAGNLLAGTKVFTFKTGDNTAPELITVNPNGLATADAHPAKLELFFVENVKVGTGNLTVYRANGTPELVVPASAVSITNKIVTITMVASLDKNTQYYVLVDEGFVTDMNDNDFVGIASTTYWTFTTGEFATGTNPTVGDSLELKVYPNPFDGFIKVSNSSKLSKVVISSITGQKVKEIVNPTEMIQTSELRSGIYLISLYVDDVVAKTERIVKR